DFRSAGTVDVGNHVDILDSVDFGSHALATPVLVVGTTGALLSSATVEVSQHFDWLGGSISGSGAVTLDAGGTMTISGTATKTLDSRTLNNQGTIGWSGGDILLSNTAVIDNDALFDVQCNKRMYHDGTGVNAAFHNLAGANFTKSVGISRNSQGQYGDWTTFDHVSFDNAGSVALQQGVLFLGGGGSHTGTFTGANATALLFGGDHTFAASSQVDGDEVDFYTGSEPGSIVFAGNYRAVYLSDFEQPTDFRSAGTIDVGNHLNLLNTVDFGSHAISTPVLTVYSTGELVSSAPVEVSQHFDWLGGGISGSGAVTLDAGSTASLSGGTLDGSTFTNQGAVTWSTGNLVVRNGGILKNGSGATFGSTGNTNTITLNNGMLSGSGTINA